MFKINEITEIEGEANLDRRRGQGSDGEETATRLQRLGLGSLSTAELLAQILGPGGRTPPLELARALLSRFGSLPALARQHPLVLTGFAGIGPARARRLVAACELALRLGERSGREGLAVRQPEDLHALLRRDLSGLDRERFLALYLDTRHRILTVEIVSVGSLNASLVHPREVFKTAVALSAAAVIVAHNHPSGHAEPSGDDLELTARLDRCGRLLGIALLDHLVVGDVAITSIREYGWPDTPG
jgi:DNA repair protein RadC